MQYGTRGSGYKIVPIYEYTSVIPIAALSNKARKVYRALYGYSFEEQWLGILLD